IPPSRSRTTASNGEPRWNLAPDPVPRRVDPLASSLAFPIEEYRAHCQLPLLADLDGPFALFAPGVPLTAAPVKAPLPAGSAGGAGEGGDGVGLAKPAPKRETKPSGPLPLSATLVDLRTGKVVGRFDGKSPFWRDARLSPDGKYLVGPYGAANDPQLE